VPDNTLNVRRVPLGDLSLDPANARSHGGGNMRAIADSLRRFGQQKPIVVDADGIVRAGNGTLTAAKRLRWETITVARSSLRGAEAAAYAIADNRTNDLSDFDDDALRQVISSLHDNDGIDADQFGFDADALAELMPDEQTPTFEPIEAPDNTRLDEKAGPTITCPECGHEFQS